MLMLMLTETQSRVFPTAQNCCDVLLPMGMADGSSVIPNHNPPHEGEWLNTPVNVVEQQSQDGGTQGLLTRKSLITLLQVTKSN